MIEDVSSRIGIQGKRVVWRVGGEIRVDTCIAPDVALPLDVFLREDDGTEYDIAVTQYQE